MLRVARELSQEELAGIMDRSVFTVSQIERGKSLPKVETLMDISAALKCNIGDIIMGGGTTQDSITKNAERAVQNEIWTELMCMDLKSLKVSLAVIKGIQAVK